MQLIKQLEEKDKKISTMEDNIVAMSFQFEKKNLDEEEKDLGLSHSFDEVEIDDTKESIDDDSKQALKSMKDGNDDLESRIGLLSEQESKIGAITDINDVYDSKPG